MKFSRCGGLSAVKQTHYSKKLTGFHSPPARRGTYAFIWPYYELFLVAWNKKNKDELEHKGFRIFEYTGPIWCHFSETKSSVVKGAWYKTDTETLQKVMNKVVNSDRRAIQSEKWFRDFVNIGKFNPYIYAAKDHLEVFIEHVK